MRDHAYALSKPIHAHAESTADEVRRIWERWNAGGVSACRYCGAPMILHIQSDCEYTQAKIANEENPC